MSQGLVERQNLEDIADAIRSKNGSSDTYTPAEMAQAISGIHTADEVVLVQKTVNANGQYNASDDSADGYSGVRVNVPNSYSASDEGKVVSSGNLVAQTTKQITANGTHDTTTNNSVSVDVPNSYAASDNGKVVVNQELVAQTSKNINANGTYNTTENNEVVVNVSGGGSSTGIIQPVYQGLTYIYVTGDGERIYTDTTKNQFLNIFTVQANHKYALFVGETVSSRRRCGFFQLTPEDISPYWDTMPNEQTFLFGDGIWLAPTIKEQDDAGALLKGRIIYTPTNNGIILFGTSNTSAYAPAYCIDITNH